MIKNLPIEDFKFIHETHKYEYNGKELPSVTQIIKLGKSISGVDNILEFGSNIHNHLDRIQKGVVLIDKDLSEPYLLNAYKKALDNKDLEAIRSLTMNGEHMQWVASNILNTMASLPVKFNTLKVAKSEHFVVSELDKIRFAGRVDYYCVDEDGNGIVIDYKSGKNIDNADYKVQLSTYAKMLGAKKAFIVGEHNWVEVNIEDSFPVFYLRFKAFFGFLNEQELLDNKQFQELSKRLKDNYSAYRQYDEDQDKIKALAKTVNFASTSNEFIKISKNIKNSVYITINEEIKND